MIFGAFLNDQSGQGIIEGFLAMAVGGAVLIVGTYVVNEINTSIASNSSDIASVFTKIMTGMKMGGVALLGIGAALTIRSLMGVGGR